MTDDALLVASGRTVSAAVVDDPYNSGEVEIRPHRSVGRLSELSDDELDDLADWIGAVEQAVTDVYHPGGVNSGVVVHPDRGLAWRVVPRWSGDTNFMPVIAGVKVLPETPAQSAERLRHGISTPS